MEPLDLTEETYLPQSRVDTRVELEEVLCICVVIILCKEVNKYAFSDHHSWTCLVSVTNINSIIVTELKETTFLLLVSVQTVFVVWACPAIKY